MASTTDLTEWLSDNPKMMGALWTMMLLVAETGSVAAGTKMGP